MAAESAVERELAIRLEAFRWLSARGDGAELSYGQLAEFSFHGQRIPLKDRGRGIRKPRELSAALSISTVYTPPDQVPPYADAQGSDGFPRYNYQGEDPDNPDNRALRRAMQEGLPLIWFVGLPAAVYRALYPVYVVAEEAEHHQFVVAVDQGQQHLWQPGGMSEDDRRYAERISRQRLHQPVFRARVLAAYDGRCCMCRLRHVSLLDAGHIIPDGRPLGLPVVPNGLALCKIHHAAFDQNILGVTPDLGIVIRKDILAEIDGPMLRHGLQELHGGSVVVPRSVRSRPDRDRLELRYDEFRAAA